MSDFANQIIKEMRAAQDAMKSVAEESESVINGDVTVEEELEEPEFQLFNNILESTIDIFNREDIQKRVVNIGKSIGAQQSQELVQLIALVSTISAHNALLFYDEKLKKEISINLDNILKNVNNIAADVQGHEGALAVFKKKISNLEKSNISNEIKKEMN